MRLLKGGVRPSIVWIYAFHLLILFGASASCFFGLRYLVERQVLPYFYQDFYDKLRINFLVSETPIALAIMKHQIFMATQIVDHTEVVNSNEFYDLQWIEPWRFSSYWTCSGKVEVKDWGRVCHEGPIVRASLPVHSGDQVVANLHLEFKLDPDDWPPYQKMGNAVWAALLLLFSFGALLFLFFYHSTARRVRMAMVKIERAETEAEFTPILKELPFQELQTVTMKLADRSKKLSLAVAEANFLGRLSALATRIAHDLRSPLTLLSVYSENPERLHNEEEKNLFQQSVSGIRYLMDELLKQYRNEGTSQELAPSCFVLASIRSTVSEARTLLKNRKIKFEVNSSEELAPVCIPFHKVEFDRIFSNLLTNAVESFPVNSTGTISVHTQLNENQLVIEIRDTGKGMSEEILSRVRKGEGSFQKTGGTGLGVRNAIAALEKGAGDLFVESTIGKGTMVRLTVPKASDPIWLQMYLHLETDRKIIVIDDAPTTLELWKQKLVHFDAKFINSMPSEHFFTGEESRSAFFLMDYHLDDLTFPLWLEGS